MTISNFEAQAAEVRSAARAWLADHWDPTIEPAEWRRIAVDSGWACPTFPLGQCGRGLAPAFVPIVAEEFARVGARSPAFGEGLDGQAIYMATAMLVHGSEDMKATLMPKVLRGDLGGGVLLYSEPGAGSDLAGLQTRADRDGDGYRINGQKIWSTGAMTGGYGCLVARTNWDLPKHQGLSFFCMPLAIDGVRRKGIEVRPIKQMTGLDDDFCEVFFEDAWVPAENLIGDENDGWRVLQTVLARERFTIGTLAQPKKSSFDVVPVLGDAADLVDAARRGGKFDDANVRQMIAQIHTWRLAQAWTMQRDAAAQKLGGTSSLASIGKLANARIQHTTGALLRLVAGHDALLYDYNAVDVNSPNYRAMRAFVSSIGGGTDQIQRNVLSERVLGMPKGPDPYHGVPFKDVPKDAATRRFS